MMVASMWSEKNSNARRRRSVAVKHPAVCYPGGGHGGRHGEDPGGPGLYHRD